MKTITLCCRSTFFASKMFDYDLENELFDIEEAEEDNRAEGPDADAGDEDAAKKDGEEDGKKKKVRVVPKRPLPKLDTVRCVWKNVNRCLRPGLLNFF